MQEPLRLSVADAATRLGVSIDTIRRKLKRGQLIARRDNRGQWWVELPADAAPAEKPMQQHMQPAAYGPTPDASALLVDELRSQVMSLRSTLEAMHKREADERERHAAEVARLEKLLAYATRPWWRRLAG